MSTAHTEHIPRPECQFSLARGLGCSAVAFCFLSLFRSLKLWDQKVWIKTNPSWVIMCIKWFGFYATIVVGSFIYRAGADIILNIYTLLQLFYQSIQTFPFFPVPQQERSWQSGVQASFHKVNYSVPGKGNRKMIWSHLSTSKLHSIIITVLYTVYI